MANTTNSISGKASDDLLSRAAEASDAPLQQAPRDESGDDPNGRSHTTGILPSQELEYLVKASKEIRAAEQIQDTQYQPASLDLRLGSVAFRVRASFLPGKGATVKQRLEDLAMHEMDISNGGVLERGCVYIVPLLEGLSLKKRMSAVGNPKSSTGRLDIFTRLIIDNGTEFDRVREQYSGPLYAEVSPRTFSILVRKGSKLSQIRIRRGNPPITDPDMRRLQQEVELVGSISGDEIRDGVPVSVDVKGDKSGLIGYKAKNHAGLIDIDKIQHYDVLDYWEPIYAPRRGGLVLDPADFYILASREPVKVPPTHAAEMLAYDTLVGEFRVRYAGFFDPGFGHPQQRKLIVSRARNCAQQALQTAILFLSWAEIPEGGPMRGTAKWHSAEEALKRLSRVPHKQVLTTKKQMRRSKNGAVEKPRRAGK